ncbi:MAG: DUF2249 domain-containing protein [Anaerolineaceae bacterium]
MDDGCMLPGMMDIHLDNRGLQPPEPLVRILEALSGMSPEDQLVALMDREPLMLYPELERRGYTWTFVDGETQVLTVAKADSA